MRVSFNGGYILRTICGLICYNCVNREIKDKGQVNGNCLKVFAGFQEQSDINNSLKVLSMADLRVVEKHRKFSLYSFCVNWQQPSPLPLTQPLPFASSRTISSIRSAIFYFIKREINSPADKSEYRKEHTT